MGELRISTPWYKFLPRFSRKIVKLDSLTDLQTLWVLGLLGNWLYPLTKEKDFSWVDDDLEHGINSGHLFPNSNCRDMQLKRKGVVT